MVPVDKPDVYGKQWKIIGDTSQISSKKMSEITNLANRYLSLDFLYKNIQELDPHEIEAHIVLKMDLDRILDSDPRQLLQEAYDLIGEKRAEIANEMHAAKTQLDEAMKTRDLALKIIITEVR